MLRARCPSPATPSSWHCAQEFHTHPSDQSPFLRVVFLLPTSLAYTFTCFTKKVSSPYICRCRNVNSFLSEHWLLSDYWKNPNQTPKKLHCFVFYRTTQTSGTASWKAKIPPVSSFSKITHAFNILGKVRTYKHYLSLARQRYSSISLISCNGEKEKACNVSICSCLYPPYR